jgi:hypothetical protein
MDRTRDLHPQPDQDRHPDRVKSACGQGPRPQILTTTPPVSATPRTIRVLVSGGREPPPPALAEPYVTVARHTAPTDRRRVIETSCQWANSVGCRCFTTANA